MRLRQFPCDQAAKYRLHRMRSLIPRRYRDDRPMRIVPIIEFVDVDALPPPGSDRGGAYAEMLAALASERIVIVFCSRRTRAEVESMRQALGVFHPFVCEDGAALFVPERYFGDTIENARRVGGYEAIEFAASYESVGATLHRVADRLNIGVLGFGDMSVELVSRECGLSLLDARLAKLREYSERFRLLCENPVAERRLFRALEAAGLTCRKGDRFHDAGSAAGAGRAISWLTARYTAAFGHVLTVLHGEAAGGANPVLTAEAPLEASVGEGGNAGARAWLQSLLQQVVRIREGHARPGAVRVAR
jgi:mannosyl-3-phosphoglycerate phosphatase